MIDYLCQQVPWLKVTLAPELNKPEHIRQLADAGVTVSIGHSAATYEQAMAGFDSGIRFATHLYNAMTATENGRTPGIVGPLATVRISTPKIVADGFHVHWANVRLAKKVMEERLCLVTDATLLLCLLPDLKNLISAVQKSFCAMAVVKMLTVRLGGSALTMIEGIQLL